MLRHYVCTNLDKPKFMFRYTLHLLLLIVSIKSYTQVTFNGTVYIDSLPAKGVIVTSLKTKQSAITNTDGKFSFDISDTLKKLYLKFTHIHLQPQIADVQLTDSQHIFYFNSAIKQLESVVVTGTMREVSRKESAVPVEVYQPKFFMKAAPPNLFEAIHLVNGVKPQLNCNICNTGDIHINGMEGAYTQVLIDGMPIVSGLATVYGLMGIPLSMIERVEIIKGPAAALYGSEAMAGTINIITKSPLKAPHFTADINFSSWNELNTDLGFKVESKKATGIIGFNGFLYDNPIDHNGDGFTDVTLQKRISLFNNWSIKRSSQKTFTLGARLYAEDRWGGQMQWTKKFRGSDEIYGESIFTKRAEFFGTYAFNTRQPLTLQFSYNYHYQDSYYGTTPFEALQQIGFVQLYQQLRLNEKQHLLAGAAMRYTLYDDNSVATLNEKQKTLLPGIFVQHEYKPTKQLNLVSGFRTDFHKAHGIVVSPRIAVKLNSFNQNHILRISTGSGFRVVNVFTEDHAALTGARTVEFASSLKPERSVNVIANYEYRFAQAASIISVDASVFYSYYFNRILPDYDTDPNKIIYSNLDGHAISRGFAVNVEWMQIKSFKLNTGFTYLDVFEKEKQASGGYKKIPQIHAPQWSGTFTVSKSFFHENPLTVDVTGNWNGPMRLPILPNDYRPEYSPWFTLLNVQLSYKWNIFECYGGIKNLFNFVPSDPIMRSFDPFDKYANDPVNNPNGYTFDPSYNYAPLQGRRGYIGLRITLK